MTKRSDYQGTGCQDPIQEKSAWGEKALRLACIFVNTGETGKLLCVALRPRVDLCSRPCPSDTRASARIPLVGVRGAGPVGGTAQHCDPGAHVSPGLGGAEGRQCCVLARPALGPAVPGTWLAGGSALCLLAWRGRDQVLAVFSAVPCAACLLSHFSQVCSTPVLFLTEVLQGIMLKSGDLNPRSSLKHLQNCACYHLAASSI